MNNKAGHTLRGANDVTNSSLFSAEARRQGLHVNI